MQTQRLIAGLKQPITKLTVWSVTTITPTTGKKPAIWLATSASITDATPSAMRRA
jgi:hypothetical protein